MPDLKNIATLAKANQKTNRKFFQQLKGKNSREVDRAIHQTHEDVFAYTDCLSCANCCKTTGPLFTDKDIVRIAKHLQMKPQRFIETYLRVDEDHDFVLQQLPCPFLDEHNYCSIYEHRPKACREYPHTDRVKQSQLFHLTLKNTAICPAVYDIVERLKKQF